jgi:hypothetical protein
VVQVVKYPFLFESWLWKLAAVLAVFTFGAIRRFVSDQPCNLTAQFLNGSVCEPLWFAMWGGITGFLTRKRTL